MRRKEREILQKTRSHMPPVAIPVAGLLDLVRVPGVGRKNAMAVTMHGHVTDSLGPFLAQPLGPHPSTAVAVLD